MTELDYYQDLEKQIEQQQLELHRLDVLKTISYCKMDAEEREQAGYLIPYQEITKILSLHKNMDEDVYNQRMRAKHFEHKVWFVSGHRDVTEDEFHEFYVPKINSAILMGDDFIVGDYHGVDVMFQEYWSENMLGSIDSFLTVYHMFVSPRNYVSKTWENQNKLFFKGGYQSDEDRDAAMTRESSGDLAWVREGKEKSGTARNLERRIEIEGKPKSNVEKLLEGKE